MERLIDLIYETIADPTLWPEVTSVLAREVGATAAWMGQLGRIEPVFFARDNLPEETIDEYVRHFAGVDLLVREWRRRPRDMEGRVVHLFNYVDERTWLSSEICNDFCLKYSIGDVLTASLSPGAKASEARFITFFRPPGEFFPDVAAKTYGILLPHLSRAARLRDAVSRELAYVPKWTAALLEQLSYGVFLLDKSGRLTHANAAGQTILRARDGLLLQPGGQLVAAERSAARRLEVVLKTCLSSQPQGTEMVVPRSSGGSWLLSACPLQSTSAEFFAGEQTCRAWVSVSDTSATRPDISARLGALFGLTPAEQRVATSLLEGRSPTEIADAHGVSLPTVRTQVQAVFSRIGVRRQAELVRILGKVAALPGGPRK